MSPSIIDILAAVAVTTCSLLLLWNYLNATKPPLPPGPARWPLVGSLFSMPDKNKTHETFTRWGKQYGDVTYVRVLAQDIIILNSSESAVELLEHRSSAYSHRPRLVMANELVGWENAVSNMNYGDTFKRTRRLLYEGLGPKAMEPFRPLQEQETIKFIQRLLDSPEIFIEHMRQTAGATVIKLMYGYDIKDRHDYFLNLAEKTIDMFSIVTTPGMFLVDMFPWLKYLPWAPFKSKAEHWRQLLTNFRDQPIEYTRSKMASGQFEPCLASQWLERLEDNDNEAERQQHEWDIRWAGVALYGGGADTPVSAISTFFISMIYYPEVQRIAQAEIDSVVGQDRLPTYADRTSLPYIEALYKEVLRWHPVGPLGVPHCLDPEKDDIYRGMLIPRGCMVIPNVGAMVSNPKVYHDPETFKPERFLGHDDRLPEPDPEKVVFGFGKRRCPGVYVAQSSVWLSITLTLATCNIAPATGPDGKPKLPSLQYSQTIISYTQIPPAPIFDKLPNTMSFTLADFATMMLAAVCVIILWRSCVQNKVPLPPGPPRWPVVGSIFSLPESKNMFDAFPEWEKKYGDVVFTQILNQKIVVVNSNEAAVELLERRAALYSQRPRMVMANELVGWGCCLATMPYGASHRQMRKLVHEGTSPKAMETLRYAQEQEALKFVQRLLDTPDDLYQHIRQTTGATLIKLIYGYDIKDHRDYFLNLAEKAVDMFAIVTTPGIFLVDTLPWLRFIPGAPFQAKARRWRKLVMDLRDQPAEYTRQNIAMGKSEPCLLASWLERIGEEGAENDETVLKWAGTTIYGGGLDTTVSSILSFFALMVHHPEAQVAAQAEIDRVIGNDRLPTYSDRESLPYIEALFKEVLRWHPAGPYGIPHLLEADEDDVYKGMLIPRGSLIIPNIIGMTRNPDIYHQPKVFNPERFLATDGSAELDPSTFIFGFGRRRCPGTHVAHSSVWFSMVLTLASYNIAPYIGPDGTPEMPSLKYTQATISQPEPFKCAIKPRSPKAKKLVEDSMVLA